MSGREDGVNRRLIHQLLFLLTPVHSQKFQDPFQLRKKVHITIHTKNMAHTPLVVCGNAYSDCYACHFSGRMVVDINN